MPRIGIFSSPNSALCKPAGAYRRISFADGSGVDLRRYR
jgi:hypothetical protein